MTPDERRARQREKYASDPQWRARRLAYTEAWRRKNRAILLESQRKANARRYARNRDIIKNAKSQPCADCGLTFPSFVMDLDHVRGQKVMAVAMMRTLNPDVLRAEIAKCDVVCSNCHRFRTYRRRGMAA